MRLYERLANEIAQAILEGRLAGGSALPTHREFAQRHHVGLSTATRAYAQLQRQGLIIGEVGRGTFVRERPVDAGPLPEAVRYTARGRLARTVDASALRTALKAVAMSPDIERLIAQPSPLGSPSVRRALCAYLARKGVKAAPGQVVAVGGGLAAMRLAALSALQRGQRVAMDAVTYPGWRLVCEQLGLEAVPVASDHRGPLPQDMEQAFRHKRAAALHCMPTAHHPLGWVMPLQRRREIVALARAHDVALIEDATYNHLVPKAPPTLAQLAPERTWLIGSLSGVLGDGLRFGYMVAPRPQEAVLEKTVLPWGLAAPPLVAELARLWMEDGTIDALQAAQHEEAMNLWKAVAATRLPSFSHSSSGWLIWLPLPRSHRNEEVVLALRSQGIDVLGNEPFAVAPGRPNAIAVRLRMLSPSGLKEAAPVILAACR